MKVKIKILGKRQSAIEIEYDLHNSNNLTIFVLSIPGIREL